jgi:heme A synthase
MALLRSARTPAGFAWISLVALVMLWVIVPSGAVVRLTASGLGCPDWPLCHGGLVPPWEPTAIIEWGHRTLAAVVGVLILAVSLWTVLRERLSRATPVAVTAVALLILQAYLGRETVRRELPPELVATHLATALVLTALLVWIAVRAQASPRRVGMSGLTTGSVILSAMSIALVMLAGAYVVANGAGLACTTWPGCAESAVPWAEGGTLQDIQWLHRGAVALAGFAILLQFGMVRRAGLPPRIHHLSMLLVALYATQVLVGASSVWFDLATITRVLHLTLGSTTWAVAIWLVTSVWATRDRAALSPSRRQQAAPASP